MDRKTSIIILSYNNLEYTKSCIESIYKYTEKDSYEIIVIDNNSIDGSRDWLLEQDKIKVIFNNFNVGFVCGCNQGINIANKDNDILLLNNDTIVTNNWLKNLKICLYSDKFIGAVGAVCNKNENRQGVSFSYDDFETMQKYALENNVSSSYRWEEKAFLIGYCLLIKREVIDKIGGLDTLYTPGYIEDNDLSIRIIKLGYKLMLCHDCFIHHYLGTQFRKDLSKFYAVLNKNREYFYSKWGFNTFCFDEVKEASFVFIDKPKKILELDCGIGCGMLALKYKYSSLVDGVCFDDKKRDIAKHFGKVFKRLEDVCGKYDYILIGDILKKVKNVDSFIDNLRKKLTIGGKIVGEMDNLISVKNINLLLKGRGKFLNNRNNYTILDIKDIFSKKGFTFKYFAWYRNFNEEEKKLFDSLLPYNKEIRYSYYTFVVSYS